MNHAAAVWPKRGGDSHVGQQEMAMLKDLFRPQVVELADRVVPAAHFLFANSSITNDGDLIVNFKEAGLGNKDESIPLTLTGEATVTAQWFNHGGNKPQGEPFSFGPVAINVTEDFPVRNGHVTGTFVIDAPDIPDEFFTHPHSNNWVARGSVVYEDIAIVDTENGVSTAGASFLDQEDHFIIDVG